MDGTGISYRYGFTLAGRRSGKDSALRIGRAGGMWLERNLNFKYVATIALCTPYGIHSAIVACKQIVGRYFDEDFI